MPVHVSERAKWIGYTNTLDRQRDRLTPADRLRYTKLRARILREAGEGVTVEDIVWLCQCIINTATK